ncbi:hypothetical protein MASR2M39_02520 [Ignavibacteriales bacterium]
MGEFNNRFLSCALISTGINRIDKKKKLVTNFISWSGVACENKGSQIEKNITENLLKLRI